MQNTLTTVDVMSGLYTCITCRVGFSTLDLQRGHYKTDWHRYNLKRKVAELPPVTADTFQQKVLAQREKAFEDGEVTTATCEICNKHFNSKNQYENHLKSKKHKDVVTKQTTKLKEEIEKNKEKNTEHAEGTDNSDLPENEKRLMKDCLNMALKTKISATGSDEGDKSRPGSNKTQMAISDEESFCGDESVEDWEENALGIEECLFCSHISSSLEANVNHMTKKHSFFLPDAGYIVDLEGLVVYLGEKVGVGHVCLWCNEKGKAFHSVQAVQKHMLDKGHCKLLHDVDTMFEYADYYDYRSSYPDFDEAAGGGDESMEVDSEEDDPQVLLDDGYELVLPSGATIGHRSLMKYYKQNLPHRESSQNKNVLPKMLAQYKALGWTGCTGEVSQKRVKDLGYMQRLKNKHTLRLSKKANKFQPHYRPQVVF
ncbi:unnamed protein product [Mytilus coruscus]|uniref:C2H2-type domain-containing protein n=1 Tax=Mytilus coruscus TaxID=42192 RepID=A0A6J8DHF2_MYTCO|nr:unnamed protein product [Mytilus coruscus]